MGGLSNGFLDFKEVHIVYCFTKFFKISGTTGNPFFQAFQVENFFVPFSGIIHGEQDIIEFFQIFVGYILVSCENAVVE